MRKIVSFIVNIEILVFNLNSPKIGLSTNITNSNIPNTNPGNKKNHG